MISLDRSRLTPFLGALPTIPSLDERTLDAHRRVLGGATRSPEMLGWRAGLLEPDEALLARVDALAAEVRDRADVLLCIGIGGSYLGADAVIGALRPPFGRTGPEIVFAGHHLSPAYHEALLRHLEGKSVYVNVISKSGTTLEPALAFRFAREFVEARFDDAPRRIIATTDAARGTLHDLAAAQGYRTFVIPDSVGGRFSVFTPVGLLPIAVAGIDARAFVAGASESARGMAEADLDHLALRYAADRFALHEAGYTTEILAVMEPALRGVGSWWQQLFGESEGKEGKGLFPVVLQYTTDLHSVGQIVQEGRRTLIETFLRVGNDADGPAVGTAEGNPDGLNDLAGQTMGFANAQAAAGTADAHAEGGVPVSMITLARLDARSLGTLLHEFMHAVAVGATLLGVDPFDQPGVEAYKKKMFARLGRP